MNLTMFGLIQHLNEFFSDCSVAFWPAFGQQLVAAGLSGQGLDHAVPLLNSAMVD